jgi:16S rRNA (adenine1518-N6/adenine1519-N6)-dimethyltransferase
VDSVVVKITFFPLPERAAKLPPHDHELLKKLVKASFQQRRKTLLNSLSASGLPGTAKELLPDLLEKATIDPRIRPERLTVEDFVRIANLMTGLD